MFVGKRDGRKGPVHFDKITSRISRLAYGLNTEFCDPVRFLALLLPPCPFKPPRAPDLPPRTGRPHPPVSPRRPSAQPGGSPGKSGTGRFSNLDGLGCGGGAPLSPPCLPCPRGRPPSGRGSAAVPSRPHPRGAPIAGAASPPPRTPSPSVSPLHLVLYERLLTQSSCFRPPVLATRSWCRRR